MRSKSTFLNLFSKREPELLGGLALWAHGNSRNPRLARIVGLLIEVFRIQEKSAFFVARYDYLGTNGACEEKKRRPLLAHGTESVQRELRSADVHALPANDCDQRAKMARVTLIS